MKITPPAQDSEAGSATMPDTPTLPALLLVAATAAAAGWWARDLTRPRPPARHRAAPHQPRHSDDVDPDVLDLLRALDPCHADR